MRPIEQTELDQSAKDTLKLEYIAHFSNILKESIRILKGSQILKIKSIGRKHFSEISSQCVITQDEISIIKICDVLIKTLSDLQPQDPFSNNYLSYESLIKMKQKIEDIICNINQNPHIFDNKYEIREDGIYFEPKYESEIIKVAKEYKSDKMNIYIDKFYSPNSTYIDKMGIIGQIKTDLDGQKEQLKKILYGSFVEGFFHFINDAKIKNSAHSKDKNGIIIREDEKRYATEVELVMYFALGTMLFCFAKENKLID